jgi:alkylation response protein AidB-like acyl-CoA dehydrogenase
VLGEVGKGWAVAMTLLGFERGEAGAVLPIRFREELDRLVRWPRRPVATPTRSFVSASRGATRKVEIMRYLGMRTLTLFLAGKEPGPDAAITKLFWSEYHKVVNQLAVDILGPAMVPSGRWPSNSISCDDPGSPPTRLVGRHHVHARWAGRSTPARRRSSATSSASASSGCPRSRVPRDVQALRVVRRRRAGRPPPRVVAHRRSPGPPAGAGALVGDGPTIAHAFRRVPALPRADGRGR